MQGEGCIPESARSRPAEHLRGPAILGRVSTHNINHTNTTSRLLTASVVHCFKGVVVDDFRVILQLSECRFSTKFNGGAHPTPLDPIHLSKETSDKASEHKKPPGAQTLSVERNPT